MKETTLHDLAIYLQEKDEKFYQMDADKSDGEESVKTLLAMLKAMPDSDYIHRSSCFGSGYDREESDIYYISDMVITLYHLRENDHYEALHDIAEVVLLKIMRDDMKCKKKYLPTNVKNALISTIEKWLTEQEG